jgi:glycosyltransferase involved in cell wall biosynthesis
MSNRLRFAFISTMTGPGWGGSEELWTLTAIELLRRGHKVSAWRRHWPEEVPIVKRLVSAGCHRGRDEDVHKIGKYANRILRMQSVSKRVRWLKDVAADVVVLTQAGFRDATGVAAECRQLGLRYCVISQAATEFSWIEDANLDEFRAMQANACQSYFVSKANRDLVQRMCGSTIAQAKVIWNPFNVRYDAISSWPADETTRLACVARLDARAKGQDLLFQVLNRDKWRNRPIVVNLYGDGIMKKGLESLAEHLGLTSVSFLGQVRDVESIWSQNHALVLPSRYEGLPLALVESMLCNRIAIVTNIGGNAEVVEDESTGFIAGAPTVELLDDAMERAWRRRKEWQSLGERAGKRIRELVPSDPVALFSNDLELVAKSGTHS